MVLQPVFADLCTAVGEKVGDKLATFKVDYDAKLSMKFEELSQTSGAATSLAACGSESKTNTKRRRVARAKAKMMIIIERDDLLNERVHLEKAQNWLFDG